MPCDNGATSTVMFDGRFSGWRQSVIRNMDVLPERVGAAATILSQLLRQPTALIGPESQPTLSWDVIGRRGLIPHHSVHELLRSGAGKRVESCRWLSRTRYWSVPVGVCSRPISEHASLHSQAKRRLRHNSARRNREHTEYGQVCAGPDQPFFDLLKIKPRYHVRLLRPVRT